MTDPNRGRPARLSRTAASVLLGVVSTVLCASSCGGSDPNNGNEPTNPSPTSATSGTTEPSPTDPTTSEPATEKDKAAAALLGYLEVRDRAYATGRISKMLNRYATGREHFGLQQFVMSLNQLPKTHFEGDWVHDVVEVEPSGLRTMLVTDCQDASDVVLIRDRDRTELPWFKDESGDEIPKKLLQAYRVVLSDDAWKVKSGASNPNRPQQC